jgi:hypothetical protein
MAGPSQRPTIAMPVPFSPAANQGGAPWSNGYPEPSRAPRQGSSGDGDLDEATKRNPLVDLIDTEKVYVAQLGLVIRVSLHARFSFVLAKSFTIFSTPPLSVTFGLNPEWSS